MWAQANDLFGKQTPARQSDMPEQRMVNEGGDIVRRGDVATLGEAFRSFELRGGLLVESRRRNRIGADNGIDAMRGRIGVAGKVPVDANLDAGLCINDCDRDDLTCMRPVAARKPEAVGVSLADLGDKRVFAG
jgi:hypothetical protein